MTWEIIFVLALLVFAIISFVKEKLPVDVTAILVFAVLLVVGMVTGSEKLPNDQSLINVFANSAPLTIAAMFIISLALEKVGAIELLAEALERLTKLPMRMFMTVMILSVAFISAFMNNTPVVVVFLPVVIGLARKMNTPASKLLIPMSYASIFGGVCTLMGTSTNILMSGELAEAGLKPLGMFELTAVGLPLLLLATAYLVIFGPKLLPTRETLTAILSEEERREFITEAFVRANSELIGQSFNESSLKRARGIRLLEIIRDGVALDTNFREATLEEGDRLVLSCRPSGIASAQATGTVDFIHEKGLDLEQIAAHEGAIVEGVIGPMSSITGKTIREINFRQRYRMIILAVHRHGRNVRERLETLPLDFGDTLLMMGTDQAIEKLRNSEDIILLDRPPVSAKNLNKWLPLVVGLVVAMVAAVSFIQLPIVVGSIAVMAILLTMGIVKPKEAYAAVEWRILMLIYGMLALGEALEVSGATNLAVEQIVHISDLAPDHLKPFIMLAVIYLVASICTEFLSNNATVVLMAPVAISIGAALGVDPRPLAIAVCVASSASFATPIGYQTNTYVYSVGGYRFSDFAKVGIPLNILYFVVCVFVIPIFWKF
ncbi:SLC13 family permease [Cerasicoccus fimbriatus]|uniref:SLC13 family permease n=1 Tax=Cerasicoccus fimbriatus TaxID=3014554 RepID=UPI0022B37CEA|nr:SLC13 family permease [Cerasicoccus sp. TK19100]